MIIQKEHLSDKANILYMVTVYVLKPQERSNIKQCEYLHSI